MIRAQPGWELYRSFLAVIREGSLSGAAPRVVAHPAHHRASHRRARGGAGRHALYPLNRQGLIASDGASSLVPYARGHGQRGRCAAARPRPAKQKTDRGAVRSHRQRDDRRRGIAGHLDLVSRSASTRDRRARPLQSFGRVCCAARRTSPCAWCAPSQAALFARKVGVVSLGFHAHPRYPQGARHAQDPS